MDGRGWGEEGSDEVTWIEAGVELGLDTGAPMSWKIDGNAAVAVRQGGHEGHPVGPSAEEAMQEQHHPLRVVPCLNAPLWIPLPDSCILTAWQRRCL